MTEREMGGGGSINVIVCGMERSEDSAWWRNLMELRQEDDALRKEEAECVLQRV